MATIKDISKACGISPSTVSKALNGYSDVSAETVELVRRVAAEMHYLPNSAARQLVTKVSRNIGVLFVDDTQSGLTHEFFSSILNSVKVEAESRGYDITFISSHFGPLSMSYLEHCTYRKCDGVVIACVNFQDPGVLELIQSKVPIVTIDFTYDNVSSIVSDNVEGMYELTKYIISNGHRKIAFIHGEDTSVTAKRKLGFFKALDEAGIKVPDSYILEGRYHDAESASAATRTLLNMADPPTAILYPDDFSYIGGRNEIYRRGLQIPKDISAAGYDGITLGQVLRPCLASWYQDTEAIGRQAAVKLVETIEQKRLCAPEQIKISGRLLPGSSVGRPAVSGTETNQDS